MTHTIAVIDKTGRGHAICQALIETNPDVQVHYIPGTAGAFDHRTTPVHDIALADTTCIAAHCRAHGIKMIAVTHIDALKADIASALRTLGFSVFGPSAEAAQLEMSKAFCKEICAEAGISSPTSIRGECETALNELLPQGRIRTEILDPLRVALKSRGIVYNGAIYLGLRVDASGKPHLIEVNARMGDSESEVIFPHVKEDLSAVFTLIAEGRSEMHRIKPVQTRVLPSASSPVSKAAVTIQPHAGQIQ